MPHADKGSAAVGLAYNSVIQIINQSGHVTSEDEIRQHEQHYLRFVMQDCMGLEWLRLVRKQDEHTPTIGLDSVYTALLTTTSEVFEYSPRGEYWQKPLSALEVLNREQRLVLTGDPGSGKSAFVSYLALCLAGENLGDDCANLRTLTEPLPDAKGNPQTREVKVEGKDKPEKQEVRQRWEHPALIPVRLILRDFSASRHFPASDAAANARCVLDFLHQYLQDNCLEAYRPILDARLRTGEALVMFDGLDEVPQAGERRKRLIACLDAFVRTFASARFLVTCRPYAYDKPEWKLASFAETHLAAFTDGQMIRFIQRWYGSSRDYHGEAAQQRADKLQRSVLERPSLKKLAARPLLLSLIVSLHANRHELPERRADLYERLLELLIDEWEKARFKAMDASAALACEQHSLAEYLQTGQDSIRLVLERLAFAAHARQDQDSERETADIAAGQLVNELLREGKAGLDLKPLRLCEYLRDRVGILYQRGGASEMDAVYTFPHRSFQEYLAAAYLRREEKALFERHGDYEEWHEVAAHLGKTDPDRWREVVVLAGGIKAQKEPGQVWNLLDSLHPADGDSKPQQAARGLRLAAEIMAENVRHTDLSKKQERIFQRIRHALPEVLPSQFLKAVERAAIGHYLTIIGDPRPEIMTVEAMPFCDIPAGKFWMGKGKYDENSEELGAETPAVAYGLSYSYQMAKYPVTVAQFRQFAEATGVKYEHALHGDANSPVVEVSQTEAMQFCQWLTQYLHDKNLLSTNLRITLPNEAEWEKAARGGLDNNHAAQRRYPWEKNEISDEHLNYDGNINRVTTPGIYPQGASPYGCEDLAGNVWEWTSSEYGKYPYPAVGTEEWKKRSSASGDRAGCVLRGGAFNFDQGGVRCVVRDNYRRDGRYLNVGFRCCVVPIALASETSGRWSSDLGEVKVFVSYSWCVERGTGIVAELEKHCPPRRIHLLRDNNEIRHGELIQQFMDKLTGGEHVITIFSKPYFQSPWCMYELLRTWQKGDFQQRTHPIIADDCDLQNMAYRIGVVDYWVAEHAKIRKLLEGRDPALFVDEYERANIIRDISQNASKLMNFAAGRLTTPLSELRARDYAPLLDSIQFHHMDVASASTSKSQHSPTAVQVQGDIKAIKGSIAVGTAQGSTIIINNNFK